MTEADKVLDGITRLGFDTSPFIYFVESHPVYLPLMRKIIGRVDSGGMKAYSSVITLTEILVHPQRKGQEFLRDEYQNLFRNSRNFELVPIDIEIATHAAELRNRYKLRTPDALQIAEIISVNCEAFLSNDKKLKQINELKVIILDDLLMTKL